MIDQVITAKQTAVVAFVVPSVATVLTVLLSECDIWNVFLYAIVYFCFIPLIMFGIYVMATGNAAEWINMGINWRDISKEKERDCVSYLSMYTIIGSIIIMIGMTMVFMNVIVLLVMIIAGTLILFIPIIRIKSKNGISKIPRRRTFTKKGIWSLTAITLIIAIIPSGIILSESSNVSEVTVVLSEESFTVNAPMFDHTFLYDDISSIELDNNFDKGSRINGYGTNIIHSGHFRNSTLGDYELASYTKITPCVIIFVSGNAYAFNQSSDESTQELYEELLSKINP